MELIVKIGADQQGLSDTINRITQQFKTMNTSMPQAWGAQSAAVKQYGSVVQASAATGGMDKLAETIGKISPVAGELMGKFSGMLGPIGALSAGLGALAGLATAAGNKMVEASALSRQSRITGASAGMLKTFGRAAELAGVDKDSAFNAINRFNAKAGAFNQGDAEAQKLFGELGINPSGQNVDDTLMQVKQQFAGITDPAKRARLSKGLFGRGGFEMSETFSKMDSARSGNFSEGRDIEDIAAARKKPKLFFNKVGIMFDDITTMFTADVVRMLGMNKGARKGNTISGGASQTIGEEADSTVSLNDTKQKLDAVAGGGRLTKNYKWKDGSIHDTKEPKERFKQDRQSMPFDFDAMGQVGLFTGSSLAYSGGNDTAQQQIDLLTGIRDNTARLGEGDFK